MICRFCHDDIKLNHVRYSLRANAHIRCFIQNRAGPSATPREVAAALDQLRLWQVEQIGVLGTFDKHPRQGVMSELGMSVVEFANYVKARRARELE